MNDDDVFPIEHGDIPAIAMLGLPKGTFCTPPKFNMEPEKKSLEKEVPLGNHHFQIFQIPC